MWNISKTNENKNPFGLSATIKFCNQIIKIILFLSSQSNSFIKQYSQQIYTCFCVYVGLLYS